MRHIPLTSFSSGKALRRMKNVQEPKAKNSSQLILLSLAQGRQAFDRLWTFTHRLAFCCRTEPLILSGSVVCRLSVKPVPQTLSTLGELLCIWKGTKLKELMTPKPPPPESAMGTNYRNSKQNSGQIYDRAINGNTEKLRYTEPFRLTGAKNQLLPCHSPWGCCPTENATAKNR